MGEEQLQYEPDERTRHETSKVCEETNKTTGL